MSECKPGFRIGAVGRRPDRGLVERLARLSTPNVADAMGRFRVMDPSVKAVYRGARVAGPAVTVMARPADNLMVHKAIEVASPGDIIVVSTGGNDRNAVWGELMTRSALAVRVGGLVVDGAVRDSEALAALGFPAFSRTVCAAGCDKDGPGEINYPISCGGVAVCPGDLILGDEDGVIVVPSDDAERIIARAEQIVANEEKRVREIDGGKVFKDDINATLKSKGVI